MLTDASQSELAKWLATAMPNAPGVPLGHGYQAVVHRYESPVGAIVVKSPHRSPLAGYFGRYAIHREHRIYRQLEGVPGIPRVYGLIDDQHLVLQAIEGPSLREYEPRLANRERFFTQLLVTIDAMHAAGVAHGDLKRKANILVGPDERPYLIDFGIACRRGERGFRRLRFEWTRQLDYNAWIKLKYGRNPEAMSETDAARYRPLWIERMFRWVRIPWQKITLRRARQKLRRWWGS